MDKTMTSKSKRILSTPTKFAQENYCYVQEVGSLISIEPHVSRRQNLNSFLFMVVEHGSGTLFYEGKKTPIQAGDCVLLNCQNMYAHESSKDNPWTLHWVHFYGNSGKMYYNHYQDLGFSTIFRPKQTNRFLELLTNIYKVQEGKESFMELLCNQYLTELITLCFLANKELAEGTHTIMEKLLQIQHYIDEYSTTKITLESLASQFFISKFHLSREFHKAFGVTINHEIRAKRISKAKSMLRFTADSIETIALNCGFSDATYFIKVFKKMEEMTPLEYRNKW